MKHIIVILILVTNINVFSQTASVNPTRGDFLGTWEWQNGNEVFRINFFNYSYQYEGQARTTLSSHFTMLETDNTGNESIVYTSDRPMEGTNEYWMPMISGGRYLDWIDSFRFSLRDNTTNYFLLGVLDLKFLTTSSGEPLQISWKLTVDGMADEDQVFNVPTNIILTKVE